MCSVLLCTPLASYQGRRGGGSRKPEAYADARCSMYMPRSACHLSLFTAPRPASCNSQRHAARRARRAAPRRGAGPRALRSSTLCPQSAHLVAARLAPRPSRLPSHTYRLSRMAGADDLWLMVYALPVGNMDRTHSSASSVYTEVHTWLPPRFSDVSRISFPSRPMSSHRTSGPPGMLLLS